MFYSEVSEEIKKLRKGAKPVPKHLISTKFLILREIAEMTQRKLSFSMTSTLDVSISDIAEKFIN